MRRLLGLSGVIILTGGSTLGAQSEIIQKPTANFDRAYLDDDAKAEFIRSAGNLSGKTTDSPKEQPSIAGGIEYDFDVAKPGWYVLHAEPDGGGHEFIFDGKELLYGYGSSRIGNIWLDEGKHALRIQRNFWTGFGAITGWKLVPAETAIDRIAVRSGNPWNVIRKGETLPLTISFGRLAEAVKLSIISRKVDDATNEKVVEVILPASEGRQEIRSEISGTEEGIFEATFKINDQEVPAGHLPRLKFGVVDTVTPKSGDGQLKKILVAEIDCASREPDYFKGGDTRVVKKPLGSYRESGDIGYLQHMNSTEPSWFAYTFKVDDPSALYWLEFDYPDDARRTFLVIPRSGNARLYAGPATGPDSGREFSLTNKMQTMGMYFWPQDTDLRCVVLQPQSGLRAAVSKVRIYKVDGGMAPLPVAKSGGRDFIHWYEEGSSYLGFFGATGKSLSDVLLATDNWARIMAHAGASLLMPTVNIYQPSMYPSAYNLTFTDSNTFDSVRIIELICEKYGLRFAGEFHPEGRQLEWVPAKGKTTDSIYQFDRLGNSQKGSDHPKFNFLNPEVEKFVIDMIGEFGDRYGDSPAFAGASIRMMDWQNTGFGNFGSLDWGYGDFTIGLFERETGVKIPGDPTDPERFRVRYEWLKTNAASQWIEWRCRKATEFFVKVRDRLRQKNKSAVLYLNYFLTPNKNSSDEWYGRFMNFPKEAGIDPEQLARHEGIELISALTGHGRRSSEAADQRMRDGLLQPDFLRTVSPNGSPARFLSGQAYFEATEKVAPPADLGYPANAPHGWVSGNVDPAGRHYLERYALQVAEADALAIGDGGNAYTVGQPLLREFLREFRALPRQQFQARQDARDPVAIWELNRPEGFLFYAVNRERYPVKVRLEFEVPAEIKCLATGEKISLSGKLLEFSLEPYELRTFSAPADTKIVKVATSIPPEDLNRVEKMTAWLNQLAADIASGTIGMDLTPAQKTLVAEAAQEAATCLKESRYWRARTLQESQLLREIYDRCGLVPPLLDQNGLLKIPETAIPAKELESMQPSKHGALVASEKIAPDWIGQEVLLASAKELAFAIEVPADGKFQLKFGMVTADGFSDSVVKLDGKEIGALSSANKGAQAALVQLPGAVSLSKGKHEISLTATGGKGPGLLFFENKAIYQDIVANRWMIAGPFVIAQKEGPEADAAIKEAIKNAVFPPETSRDFSAAFETALGQQKWRRQNGPKDFVDFRETTGYGFGSLHYAVTYIVSPEARDVEVSYSTDYFAKIWLNGQVLQDYFHPAGHPEKGQKKQIIRLNKGTNELLLKIAAGSGGNGFWFAVNNPGDLKFAPIAGKTSANSH